MKLGKGVLSDMSAVCVIVQPLIVALTRPVNVYVTISFEMTVGQSYFEVDQSNAPVQWDTRALLVNALRAS